MHIVPIIRRTVRATDAFRILQFWILLERNGTYCMEVDSMEQAVQFASENGLELTSAPVVEGTLIFLPVSAETKGLNLFYTWDETSVAAGTLQDVWRPFIWVDGDSDALGTNVYLSEIPLTPSDSVATVLSTYFKARPVTIVDEFHPQQTQDSS
jgi:hypothetical protein